MQLNKTFGEMTKNPVAIVSFFLLLLIGITAFIFFNGRKPAATVKNNTPSQLQGQKPAVVFDETLPDTSKGNVEASSEIDGIKVLFVNQNELINLLDKWGIYNRFYDLKENGKNTGGVNNVKFVLTDKPMTGTVFYYQNKTNGASALYAKAAELEVKVYVIRKNSNDNVLAFSNGALYALYMLSHPYKSTVPKDELDKIFTEYLSSNPKITSLFSLQTNK